MSTADRLTLLLPGLVQTLFVLAVGCSLGSLVNVLVYRLPRGLDVVTPSSRCPSCQTRLTWRENIPVLGWLLLRGRCRFCRSPISVEYPLVEAFTGVLLAGVFALWFLGASRPGGAASSWAPEWASNGTATVWPILAVIDVALVCAVAMTLIDARTYTIPLVLTWVPAVTAVLVLPGHAAWFASAHGEPASWVDGANFWRTTEGDRWFAANGWVWSLPTPPLRGWWWIGASIGAVLGLATAAVMVRLGWIGRSFEGYDAWETAARAEADRDGTAPAEGPDAWIRYPHARREMVKELAFLGPAALMGAGGGWLGERAGAWFTEPSLIHPGAPLLFPGPAPLWLVVLGGVCLGYLVGGGVVWLVRIGATLAFGKEAMGIGDVHLMAALGACFGWIDAVIGFFLSAFLALAWTAAGLLTGGRLRRAMPYGPFLAAGVVLVALGKPAVEFGLTRLLGSLERVDLP